MEIKRQKSQRKGKVEVDGRKLAKEEKPVEPPEGQNVDAYAANLQKFEAMLKKKNTDDDKSKNEVKDINEEQIFKNVMDLAKATDDVGGNQKFSPVKGKKTSYEAPDRIGASPAIKRDLLLKKAASEFPQASKETNLNTKEEPQKISFPVNTNNEIKNVHKPDTKPSPKLMKQSPKFPKVEENKGQSNTPKIKKPFGIGLM